MSKNILVIDDDNEFADTVLKYDLERMGFRVRTVSDLHAARQELSNQTFSLVTVDMNLQRDRDKAYFEGEIVLEEIRDTYGKIPCIIISGSTPPGRSFTLARQYPMIPEDGYLEKQNFNRRRFRDLVSRILGTPESTRMAEDQTRELNSLAYELQSINDLMATLEKEYKDGKIDFGRYSQLKIAYGRDRYELIGKVQDIVNKKKVYEDLDEALEQTKSHVDDSTVKSSLKEQAEKKGWGKRILEEIDKHKGDIVGLIVNLAIELGKQATMSRFLKIWFKMCFSGEPHCLRLSLLFTEKAPAA